MQLSILLLFCITLNFSCTDARRSWDSSGKGKIRNYCSIFPAPNNNLRDIKWLTENVREGWNIQFGNPTGRALIGQLIRGLGNNNLINDDLSRMCPRLRFDIASENLFAGVYSGYGGKQAIFSCTPGGSLACNITSSDRRAVLSSRDYISYIDGKGKGHHNLAAIVKCLPNGEVIWYAMTVSRYISEEETNTINQHFKSLGFNPDISVPMQSESCRPQNGKGPKWGNRWEWGQRRQWG